MTLDQILVFVDIAHPLWSYKSLLESEKWFFSFVNSIFRNNQYLADIEEWLTHPLFWHPQGCNCSLSNIYHGQGVRRRRLLAWHLSLALIDPLGCCAPFTACGLPAHTLMSSSCLLQLVRNECGLHSQAGPALPCSKYLNTTCIFMQIRGIVMRVVCAQPPSDPAHLTNSLMMVQLICLRCFIIYMWTTKLPQGLYSS